MTDSSELGLHQAQLIFAAGIALFHLQQLENVVKLCCAFMEVEDKKATYENLFSEDPKAQHSTLGTLLNLLKKPTCFKKPFLTRLNDFVSQRNEFIHKLWPENQIYSLDENLSEEMFSIISEFLNHLDEETIYMTKVFCGFCYSIGTVLAEREGKLAQ